MATDLRSEVEVAGLLGRGGAIAAWLDANEGQAIDDAAREIAGLWRDAVDLFSALPPEDRALFADALIGRVLPLIAELAGRVHDLAAADTSPRKSMQRIRSAVLRGISSGDIPLRGQSRGLDVDAVLKASREFRAGLTRDQTV